MNRSDKIYLRVDKDNKRKIKQATKELHFASMSAFIRQITLDYIDNNERKLHNEK